MELGLIGLGRMSANMAQRLLRAGHSVVGYARHASTVQSRFQVGRYDFNLPDVAEVWRRGIVIALWLLDLTASALLKSPELADFGGRVSDPGEGRWTITAAIDEAVPVPVLSNAPFERVSSRGEIDLADKLLSAMRFEFGGHLEKAEEGAS